MIPVIWNAGHPLKIAVNISCKQFEQKNMPHLVQASLDLAGLDAHYLELEMTETMLMNDSSATIEMLKKLKSVACRCRSTISARVFQA